MHACIALLHCTCWICLCVVVVVRLDDEPPQQGRGKSRKTIMWGNGGFSSFAKHRFQKCFVVVSAVDCDSGGCPGDVISRKKRPLYVVVNTRSSLGQTGRVSLTRLRGDYGILSEKACPVFMARINSRLESPGWTMEHVYKCGPTRSAPRRRLSIVHHGSHLRR